MSDQIEVGDNVMVLRTGEMGVVTNILGGALQGDVEVRLDEYTVCVPSGDLAAPYKLEYSKQ